MSTYLTTLQEQLPQHADAITQMKDLHQKKLWHQLTDVIQAFIEKPEVRAAVPLTEFYERVIADFASRANQLRLAAIAVSISYAVETPDEKLAFLEKVLGAKYIMDHKEATIVLSSRCAVIEASVRYMEKANERLDKLETLLERLPSAEAVVHASFHKAKAQYYKAAGEAQNFHRSALQWLAYEQLEDITEGERAELAFDLSLSALHGTDIYNFGETLEKGVVDVLSSSGKEWLAKILLALNQGKIEEWRSLEKQYAKEIAQHLAGQSALLNQKASILSVIELIFTRSSEARIISFQDIATASHIPVNQVEHLLMKALALGLLKGRIDQISSSFNVSWVQPRVLSQAQITLMKDRLYTWRETVGGALSLMESQISPEILS